MEHGENAQKAEEFNVGDTVYLKSGSLALTVDGRISSPHGLVVTVVWMWAGALRREQFMELQLSHKEPDTINMHATIKAQPDPFAPMLKLLDSIDRRLMAISWQLVALPNAAASANGPTVSPQ